MLAVPGCARQRQRTECRAGRQCREQDRPRRRRSQHRGLTRPPVHHKINVEGDADAQQQRQRNDVGVVQQQPAEHDDDDGHQRRQQQRRQHKGHVEQAPQCNEQDDRDRYDSVDRGRAKSADDRRAGRFDGDGGAAGVGRHRGHLRDELGKPLCIARLRLRQDLNAGAPVRQEPIAAQIRRDCLQCDRLGLQRFAQLVELGRQETGQRPVRRDHHGVGRGCQFGQILVDSGEDAIIR